MRNNTPTPRTPLSLFFLFFSLSFSFSINFCPEDLPILCSYLFLPSSSQSERTPPKEEAKSWGKQSSNPSSPIPFYLLWFLIYLWRPNHVKGTIRLSLLSNSILFLSLSTSNSNSPSLHILFLSKSHQFSLKKRSPTHDFTFSL